MMIWKCKMDSPLGGNRLHMLEPHRCVSIIISVGSTLFLTCFFGELREGLHSLLPVAALRGDGGDVAPTQGSDDVHHGLRLEGVGRNHPGEEVVAPVVAQLRSRRRVADLWDLEGKRNVYVRCCSITGGCYGDRSNISSLSFFLFGSVDGIKSPSS